MHWNRKQRQEYVRIAIEQSLSRKVDMGPSLAEKRGKDFRIRIYDY